MKRDGYRLSVLLSSYVQKKSEFFSLIYVKAYVAPISVSKELSSDNMVCKNCVAIVTIVNATIASDTHTDTTSIYIFITCNYYHIKGILPSTTQLSQINQ